jgi:hypothetical protein
MARSLRDAVAAAGAAFRARTALIMEVIALRHQVAVLQRNKTRRPLFRASDRLLWVLFSRWWQGWRESLIIVQSETVLRWRREGLSLIWGCRSRGRWRGGRPRIVGEIRRLIAQMARDNFLWGAPRIHGELLKLGFSVSQATVSRYMPEPHMRRTQTWRTFIQNQLAGIGPIELPNGGGVPDSLRFHLRSRTRRFLLRLARLITAALSGFHQRPAWSPANSRLLCNVTASSWATRCAIPRARSAIRMPDYLRNVGNGSPRAAAQSRAPPYCARASPAPKADMGLNGTETSNRAGSARGALKSQRCLSRRLALAARRWQNRPLLLHKPFPASCGS